MANPDVQSRWRNPNVSILWAKESALRSLEHLRRDVDYDYPASVIAEKRRMATRAIKDYEAALRAR